MQTLEGGLRVDAEDPEDWSLLENITMDAASCDEGLAKRLGSLINDHDLVEDWSDYIVPDLDEAFHSDLSYVTAAIAAARLETAGGPGPLWITRDDAMRWYSALNQARLSLEETHRLGPSEKARIDQLDPSARSAYFRSQFYCAIQSLILDRVLR